jgi:hypothetical protein
VEEEEASPPAKAGDKTDGAKTAFDKIDDDRKRKSCLIYILTLLVASCCTRKA